MLEPIHILPIIFVAIGPSEYATTFYDTIFPLTHILSTVDVSKGALAVEFAILELPVIYARV